MTVGQRSDAIAKAPTINAICLFCGAQSGTDPLYAEAVRDFVTVLAARDITLVTGGGSTGLMGVAADTMIAEGGRVIGIIPERLMQREVAHKSITDLRVVKSMHDRKAMMGEISDAFVTAPGGIGTMEELFEFFTWRQLGYHHKPVALLNVAGYYDALITFMEHAVERGLLGRSVLDQLIMSNDATSLALQLARMPDVPDNFRANAAAT
ncbi:TIGR00730 family Rossman fold protein [soil metagenome]